ncbi:para-nitrobenzyl esterase-like [Glandiceps talaboti]
MTEEDERKTSLRKRTGLILIVGVLILLFIVILTIIFLSTSHSSVVNHQIGCGKIEGIQENGGFVFKGLPYARPPIDELRWTRTQAMSEEDCWSDTYKANKFKSECTQKDIFTGGVKGNEDCLYVNVWTPTLKNDANLPVMVFIHGGYLMSLSGNEPGYSPTTKLAVDSKMVHVSFNYRLHAWGFLALDSLSSRGNGHSGNYGLWDQLMALQWVHDNIQSFGGNPGHVTIYGHSSGASCVFALLSSELTQGLFHRAVMMGGSSILNRSLEDASRDNKKIVQNAGCDGAANNEEEYQCLMALSPQEILDAVQADEYPYWGSDIQGDLPVKGLFVGAMLIVDGELIRSPPLEAWENSINPNDVPFAIGSMAQEVDYAPTPEDIDAWSWNDYETHVRGKFDTFGTEISDKVLELYPPRVRGSNPRLAFTTMASDIYVTCPYDEIAMKADPVFQKPIYRFVGTARPSKPVMWYDNTRYAFHGWEMFAFFDSMELFLSPTEKDNMFRDRMQHYLTSFARTGQMPEEEWEEWSSIGSTALISDEILYRNRFNKTRCDFWTDNGFFSYAWTN